MMTKQILNVLPWEVKKMIEQESIQLEKLQEIRIRAEQPVIFVCEGRERITDRRYQVSRETLKETMNLISNYSLYAFEDEMRQGFITITGGHRVGISGQVILEKGHVKNMKNISSINIRIAHEVKGCADPVFFHVIDNFKLMNCMLISPPACGKTTLLRDMIRQVSNGNAYLKGMTVGVADERSEIGACYRGIPQNDLGMRTDILDCCPKAEGMMMLIRSMAPQVIAVDEIGTEEDIRALEYAIHCGCKMLVTAHGKSMEDIKQKSSFAKLLKDKVFERFIVLDNRVNVGEITAIYNENGERIG